MAVSRGRIAFVAILVVFCVISVSSVCLYLPADSIPQFLDKVAPKLPTTTPHRHTTTAQQQVQGRFWTVLRSKPFRYSVIGLSVVAALAFGLLAAAWLTGWMHSSVVVPVPVKPEPMPIPEPILEDTINSRLSRWYQECLDKFSTFGLMVLLTAVAIFVGTSVATLCSNNSTPFGACPYIALIAFSMAVVLSKGLVLPSYAPYVLSTSLICAAHLLISSLKHLHAKGCFAPDIDWMRSQAVYIAASVMFACIFVAVDNVFWVLLLFSILAMSTARRQ